MPKLHTKPTPEELDENINKALQELDAEPIEEEKLVPDVVEPTPDITPEETPEPSKPIAEVVVEPEPPTPEPDYKVKFAESAREAQVLQAKSKKVNEAIDQANDVEAPTDEELAKKYPEWDIMDDIQKRLIRESELSSKRFAIIHDATKEFRDIDAWNTKVDAFVADPKTITDNPALEGKEDDFRLFATKQSRRGVDFKDLVDAFLYNVDQVKKVTPLKKGQMFETGSGGPNEPQKPKSDKISLTEAKVLRETNYPKWKEMLIAGKIADE